MTTTEIRRFADKPCAKCHRPFTPPGPRSTECKRDDCETVAPATSNGHGSAPAAEDDASPPQRRTATAQRRRPKPKTRTVAASSVESPEQAEVDVFRVIELFGLDFHLGNTVRFILEHRDGDELENLDNARTYLEKAIAQRERANA